MTMPVKDAWFVRGWGGFAAGPINLKGYAVCGAFGLLCAVLLRSEIHTSDAEKDLIGGLMFIAFWIIVQYTSCPYEDYEQLRKDMKRSRDMKRQFGRHGEI
jgi:membrane protein CcdC involved in cytochrome C biogenesis